MGDSQKRTGRGLERVVKGVHELYYSIVAMKIGLIIQKPTPASFLVSRS